MQEDLERRQRGRPHLPPPSRTHIIKRSQHRHGTALQVPHPLYLTMHTLA
jgi:hypothetical protein